MPRYTDEEKLRAVEHEITYRKRVYGRQIEFGKMTQEEAAHQIGIMEAIRDDYRKARSQAGKEQS